MIDSLVIIPTYNEKENIAKIIDAVFSLPYPFHLLIIDDSSKDGTAEIVKELQKKFPDKLFLEERPGKAGLGTAYIHGFKWALKNSDNGGPKSYAYIFEMDADFSHNPNDLLLLLNACKKNGADLAIGSRYVKGVTVINWPIGRVIMSYYASAYVRLITRMPIRDTTAGFKCYKRKVLETIDFNKIKFIGYAFQIEMKFATWKLGFKLEEVPVIFTDRQEGYSKMTSGIFSEAILGVIEMKVKSWFRSYKRE